MATDKSTGEWNMVTAYTYAVVNDAWASVSPRRWPPAQASDPQAPGTNGAGEGGRLDLLFDAWRLAVGGAGARVRLALPVPEAVWTPASGDPVTGQLLEAIIEVDTAQPTGGAKSIDLTAHADAPPQALHDAIAAQLEAWLNGGEGRAVVAGLFDAVLNLQSHGEDWLRPALGAIAVAEPIQGAITGNSVLALFAMTGDRALPQGAMPPFDATIVSANRQGVVLLAVDALAPEMLERFKKAAADPQELGGLFGLLGPASGAPIRVPITAVKVDTAVLVELGSVVSQAADLDMFGWDLVYGIRAVDVNRAIRTKKSSPQRFEQSDGDMKAAGRFGVWQIAGGAGDSILLHVPVLQASLNGAALTDSIAAVTVRLDWNQTHELVICNDTDAARGPAAVVDGLRFSGRAPDAIDATVFQDLLCTWLNNNLNLFRHVFAKVEIDRTATAKHLQWMMPTSKAYAFHCGPTLEDSVLAILCMTENRPAVGVQQRLAGNLIPDGARAGFAIHSDRVIERYVAPGVIQGFKNLTLNDLIVSDGSITLKPGDHSLTLSDGKNAVLNELMVTIAGDAVYMIAMASEKHGAGTPCCQTISRSGIKLVYRDDGKPTLSFEMPQSTSVYGFLVDIAADKTRIIIDLTVGAVGLFVGAVLAVFTDGVSLIVASVLLAIITGVIDNMANFVEAAIKNSAPPLNLTDVHQAIEWTGDADFSLCSAGLCGALRFGVGPRN